METEVQWEVLERYDRGSVNKLRRQYCDLLILSDPFEETKYKEKMLVEKVEVQTQTSSKDTFNLDLRRIVLGPHLYFRADGSPDPEPFH